MKTSHSMQ